MPSSYLFKGRAVSLASARRAPPTHLLDKLRQEKKVNHPTDTKEAARKHPNKSTDWTTHIKSMRTKKP